MTIDSLERQINGANAPLMRPRIALVDPYSTAAQTAGALADHGAETVAVLANPDPTAAAHRPAFAPSDYTHVHTVRGGIANTVNTLAALGVTGVMAGCESGVALADQLARALGLRGNDPATSSARRDKSAMARALRAVGLAHPRTFAAANVREARRAVEMIGAWPVVLKPVASSGSDQVVFARSMAEVDRAAVAILGSRDVFGHANPAVLCQQYVSGTQFAVNTVSRSGMHRLAEVWQDTRTGTAAHRMIYDRMELLRPEDQRIPDLFAYVARCLDALGIAEGPAHSEVVLTISGPVLIETGARLQGGDCVRLQREASGSSHTDIAVEALLGEIRRGRRPSAHYPYRKPVTQLFLQAPRDAMIGPAEALDALLAIPGVAGLVRPLRPGAAAPETVDLLTSPGTVYVTGRERKNVQSTCEQIRRLEAAGLYAAATDRTAPGTVAVMEAA